MIIETFCVATTSSVRCLVFEKELCSRQFINSSLHCNYLNRLEHLSRWKKWWIQLKQVILDTEPPISLAVGAGQMYFTPARPIAGVSQLRAPQYSRQTMAEVPRRPEEDPSNCTNSSGVCFQSKAALVQFTEDFLRKTNFFCTISPSICT